jgi:hypothetical protein
MRKQENDKISGKGSRGREGGREGGRGHLHLDDVPLFQGVVQYPGGVDDLPAGGREGGREGGRGRVREG